MKIPIIIFFTLLSYCVFAHELDNPQNAAVIGYDNGEPGHSISLNNVFIIEQEGQVSDAKSHRSEFNNIAAMGQKDSKEILFIKSGRFMLYDVYIRQHSEVAHTEIIRDPGQLHYYAGGMDYPGKYEEPASYHMHSEEIPPGLFTTNDIRWEPKYVNVYGTYNNDEQTEASTSTNSDQVDKKSEDNEPDPIQSGENEDDVIMKQDGTGKHRRNFMGWNRAIVVQTGSDNSAQQFQMGGAQNILFITQTGNENSAVQIQYFTNFSKSEIIQTGNENYAFQIQIAEGSNNNESGNSIFLSQTGNENHAEQIQRGTGGNSAEIKQKKGNLNTAGQTQYGGLHTAAIVQSGSNNTALQDQKGSSNKSVIMQHGGNNKAVIVQSN